MVTSGDSITDSMVDVFELALKLSYPSISPVPPVHNDTFAQIEPDAYSSVCSLFMHEGQIDPVQLPHGTLKEPLTLEYEWCMNRQSNRTWAVMRPAAPSSRPPRGQADSHETERTPSLVFAIKDRVRVAGDSKGKEIFTSPAKENEESNSCSAPLSQILSNQRPPTTLTSDGWLTLLSKAPSLSCDEAAALNAIIERSIGNLEGVQKLFGIACSLQLGLLNTSCWASCCARLENYWEQFLVLSDYPSRCQFLRIFVEFIGRLEIDETWGLKIMTDCFLLIKTTKDESTKLIIDILSTLCRRSQVVADQTYEEVCSSCEVQTSVGTSTSWVTLFLVSDFYASLSSRTPREAPKSLEVLQLLRPLEILASKLKGPSHSNDRGERFLDCLIKDFKQVREWSAEWIALLCISKLLLSEFVRRPGPFLLRHEHLDAWSSLARVLRGCEGRLSDCTLGAFMARDIRFTILAKAPTLAIQALQFLFEALGASMEAPMSAALSTFGATSDRYFAVILKLMGDSSASMRVRAIRGLSRLIDSNDPMSKNQNFMKALSNRFEDQSPLVRDAALDFYFALRKINDQGSIVLALSKLDDPSPLVRRRVIKVVETQLGTSALDPSVSSELRAALISEISIEGKTLADLSFNSLLNSWLLPFFQKRVEFLAKGEAIPLRQAVADLTAEIIKTIRSPRTSITAFQAFSARIRESARGEEWSLICREIVDLLFETLISSVESGNDSAVKFILAAIVVFATDSMDCMTAHFKLICRLILSNELEAVEHSLSLLKGLLRDVDLNLLREAPELVKDLCRLSFRGSNIIVRSAIECLGYLAVKDPSAAERLRYLVAKHRAIITPKGQASGLPEDFLRCRSLYSLSMLTRAACSNGVAIDISPDLIVDALAHIPRTDPKVAVLCAFSCAELLTLPLLAIKPRFVSIIKGILSETCATAQVSVLKGFLGLFANPNKSSVGSSFDSCASRPPDETSSSLAVFQVYCTEFQRLILEGDTRLDEILISVFTAALSQGLVPPQALIPYVLCAWHPSNLRIQQRVALQCVGLLQKFEPYLALVLRQTFKLTYQYLCKDGTSCHQLFCSADGAAESYFHELFEHLSTKSRRMEFLSSLMQEVECQSPANSYLVFLLASVAQLPFKSEEELHLVLRRMDEQIVAEGDCLELDLPRPQQIRQLLVLEAKNYLCGSYRAQPQDPTGQGPLESTPRRLKLEPLRLPDMLELESLDSCELLERFSSSLHAHQGVDATDHATIRRIHPPKRSRVNKRRKKTKVPDVADEGESSAGEVY